VHKTMEYMQQTNISDINVLLALSLWRPSQGSCHSIVQTMFLSLWVSTTFWTKQNCQLR